MISCVWQGNGTLKWLDARCRGKGEKGKGERRWGKTSDTHVLMGQGHGLCPHLVPVGKSHVGTMLRLIRF